MPRPPRPFVRNSSLFCSSSPTLIGLVPQRLEWELDDIYKPIKIVIVFCFFFLVYVQLSSFLSLIEDSKSFEGRSWTSIRVVCGNLLPAKSRRGISFFLSSLHHSPAPPPLTRRHPPFLSLQSCHLVRAPPICSATSPRCCNFLGPAWCLLWGWNWKWPVMERGWQPRDQFTI